MKSQYGQRMKKSWLMHGVILSAWAFCLAHFDPKLISLVDLSDSLPATLAIIFFIACLNIFWFYGIHHVAVVLFCSFVESPSFEPQHEKMPDGPRVAILYTSMNDFVLRAAESCLKQDYANYRLFILDDSTDDKVKEMIDGFGTRNTGVCTVIRREGRAGFKAGNLNNALKYHAADFPYFAVVDADEVIPPDFISRLLPRLCADDRAGFVQASHAANPDQPTKFARDLSETVDIFWKRYLPARERFGFLIFYGHGAIIRRDAWESAGGFPEVVSEDLAFSCRMAESGFRGRFAPDVVCYEDVPATYAQFKRRYNKWIRGAIEFLCKGFVSFAGSRNVAGVEKLDVFVSCLSLCLPIFFVLFIVIANVVIPLYFIDPAKTYQFTLPIIGKTIHLWPLSSLHPKFGVTWRWDFYLMTLLGTFAPMISLGAHLLPGHPLKFLCHFTRSAATHISIMISAVAEAIKYGVTGKAEFLVTGDSSISKAAPCRTMVLIEIAAAALLLIAALFTLNAGLFSIALAFAIGPLTYRLKWEHRLVRAIVFLPLFFITVMLTVIGVSTLGSQGTSWAQCSGSPPCDPAYCMNPDDPNFNCELSSPQCSWYCLLPPIPPIPIYF